VCATAVAAPLAQSLNSALLAGVMGAIALRGDMQLRVPLALRLELPKIKVPKLEVPKLEVPKLEVPKLSVPKLGLPKLKLPRDPKKEAKAAPPATRTTTKVATRSSSVQVRAATSSGSIKDAPTFEDITKLRGSGVEVITSEYKAFPVRRMPGANMGEFLDMAKSMTPK